MRITAKKKARTRSRIVDCAHRLFSDRGFGRTTTRDIADKAGIAAGTVFNYFPTKEALAMSILEVVLLAAAEDFESGRRGDENVEELLFARIAAELRHLAPYRPWAGEVFETVLSPFARGVQREQAERIRGEHLESVAAIIAGSDGDREIAPEAVPDQTVLHLYWTLYIGVLSFWTRDDSHHREDSLAVLDQSMRLFARSLRSDPGQ